MKYGEKREKTFDLLWKEEGNKAIATVVKCKMTGLSWYSYPERFRNLVRAHVELMARNGALDAMEGINHINKLEAATQRTPDMKRCYVVLKGEPAMEFMRYLRTIMVPYTAMRGKGVTKVVFTCHTSSIKSVKAKVHALGI